MLSVAQVTFDALDPSRLAQFWSQALGYREDDYTESFAQHPDWEGRFAAITANERDGWGPRRLHFQKVADARQVKNRVHLDLITRDVSGEVDRLCALGAVVRGECQDFDTFWVIMQDPEGNEFCVCPLPDTDAVT